MAGLAGLVALAIDAELAGQVGLNAASRILLISTEGDTAPGAHEELVGEPGASVGLADQLAAKQRSIVCRPAETSMSSEQEFGSLGVMAVRA